eukprot:tig00021433_g21275.t1
MGRRRENVGLAGPAGGLVFAEGYLHKRAALGRWKRKFFIIKGSSLLCGRKPDSTKFKPMTLPSDIPARIIGGLSQKGGKYGFTVALARRTVLFADSEAERQKWINGFLAIGYKFVDDPLAEDGAGETLDELAVAVEDAEESRRAIRDLPGLAERPFFAENLPSPAPFGPGLHRMTELPRWDLPPVAVTRLGRGPLAPEAVQSTGVLAGLLRERAGEGAEREALLDGLAREALEEMAALLSPAVGECYEVAQLVCSRQPEVANRALLLLLSKATAAAVGSGKLASVNWDALHVLGLALQHAQPGSVPVKTAALLARSGRMLLEMAVGRHQRRSSAAPYDEEAPSELAAVASGAHRAVQAVGVLLDGLESAAPYERSLERAAGYGAMASRELRAVDHLLRDLEEGEFEHLGEAARSIAMGPAAARAVIAAEAAYARQALALLAPHFDRPSQRDPAAAPEPDADDAASQRSAPSSRRSGGRGGAAAGAEPAARLASFTQCLRTAVGRSKAGAADAAELLRADSGVGYGGRRDPLQALGAGTLLDCALGCKGRGAFPCPVPVPALPPSFLAETLAAWGLECANAAGAAASAAALARGGSDTEGEDGGGYETDGASSVASGSTVSSGRGLGGSAWRRAAPETWYVQARLLAALADRGCLADVERLMSGNASMEVSVRGTPLGVWIAGRMHALASTAPERHVAEAATRFCAFLALAGSGGSWLVDEGADKAGVPASGGGRRRNSMLPGADLVGSAEAELLLCGVHSLVEIGCHPENGRREVARELLKELQMAAAMARDAHVQAVLREEMERVGGPGSTAVDRLLIRNEVPAVQTEDTGPVVAQFVECVRGRLAERQPAGSLDDALARTRDAALDELAESLDEGLHVPLVASVVGAPGASRAGVREVGVDLESRALRFVEAARADEGAHRVLLIAGDMGSGKTTVARRLVRALWLAWRPGGSGPVPLFIPLRSPRSIADGRLVTEQFEAMRLSQDQAQQAARRYGLVFVLDGFDEMGLRANLWVEFLERWAACAVVTCRTDYLATLGRYKVLFCPWEGRPPRPQLEALLEAKIHPFTRRQSTAFVRKFVARAYGADDAAAPPEVEEEAPPRRPPPSVPAAPPPPPQRPSLDGSAAGCGARERRRGGDGAAGPRERGGRFGGGDAQCGVRGPGGARARATSLRGDLLHDPRRKAALRGPPPLLQHRRWRRRDGALPARTRPAPRARTPARERPRLPAAEGSGGSARSGRSSHDVRGEPEREPGREPERRLVPAPAPAPVQRTFPRESRGSRSEWLREQIDAIPGLDSLASNPMILFMMVQTMEPIEAYWREQAAAVHAGSSHRVFRMTALEVFRIYVREYVQRRAAALLAAERKRGGGGGGREADLLARLEMAVRVFSGEMAVNLFREGVREVRFHMSSAEDLVRELDARLFSPAGSARGPAPDAGALSAGPGPEPIRGGGVLGPPGTGSGEADRAWRRLLFQAEPAVLRAARQFSPVRQESGPAGRWLAFFFTHHALADYFLAESCLLALPLAPPPPPPGTDPGLPTGQRLAPDPAPARHEGAGGAPGPRPAGAGVSLFRETREWAPVHAQLSEKNLIEAAAVARFLADAVAIDPSPVPPARPVAPSPTRPAPYSGDPRVRGLFLEAVLASRAAGWDGTPTATRACSAAAVAATVLAAAQVPLAGLDLARVRMPGALLAGANLAGASLVGADLSHASLAGACLAGADLTDAVLTGAALGERPRLEPDECGPAALSGALRPLPRAPALHRAGPPSVESAARGAPAPAITCVCVSRDGRLVAVGGSDRTVTLYEVEGRPGPARVLSGHAAAVTCLGLSADGTLLASGSDDATVRVWDVATGRETHCLRGHGGPVRALHFLPAPVIPPVLVSGAWDNTVRLWKLGPGGAAEEARTLGGPSSCAWVTSVAISADGATVAAGCDDKAVRVWDTRNGQLRHTLRGYHEAAVTVLAMSHDGRHLLSVADDGSRVVWELPTGRPARLHRDPLPLETPAGPAAAHVAAAASWPAGVAVLALPAGAGALLRDLETGAELLRVPGHRSPGPLAALALSDDARLLLLASASPDDRSLCVYDVEEEMRRQAGGYSVACAALAPLPLARGGAAGPTTGPAPSPGALALAELDDLSVRLLEAASGRETRRLRVAPAEAAPEEAGAVATLEHIRCVAWSPDGRLLAVGTSLGRVALFEPDAGRELGVAQGHAAACEALAFTGLTDNAHELASAGADGSVIMYLLRGGPIGALSKPLFQATGRHEGRRGDVAAPCLALAASPPTALYGPPWASGAGARVLAVGLGDGYVQLWDVHTGTKGPELCHGEGAVTSLAYHRGGRVIASGGADGAVQLWSVETAGALRQLRGHTGPVLALAFVVDPDEDLDDDEGGPDWRGSGADDGTRVLLASGSADHTARLWDAAAGRSLRILPGHHGRVHSVAVSARRGIVVTASADDTVRCLTWARPAEGTRAPDGAHTRGFGALFGRGRRRGVLGKLCSCGGLTAICGASACSCCERLSVASVLDSCLPSTDPRAPPPQSQPARSLRRLTSEPAAPEQLSSGDGTGDLRDGLGLLAIGWRAGRLRLEAKGATTSGLSADLDGGSLQLIAQAAGRPVSALTTPHLASPVFQPLSADRSLPPPSPARHTPPASEASPGGPPPHGGFASSMARPSFEGQRLGSHTNSPRPSLDRQSNSGQSAHSLSGPAPPPPFRTGGSEGGARSSSPVPSSASQQWRSALPPPPPQDNARNIFPVMSHPYGSPDSTPATKDTNTDAGRRSFFSRRKK